MTSPPAFLVFDTDPVACAALVGELTACGRVVLAFDSEASVLDALAHQRGHVVIYAAREIAADPAAFVKAALLAAPNAAVVVGASTASVSQAVETVRAGACTYVALEDATGAELERIADAAVAHAQAPVDAGLIEAKERFESRVEEIDDYSQRLMTTAEATKLLAHCTTFPELAAQALKILRVSLDASGGALFLLQNGRWTMMHAADLAHDFAQDVPNDDALEQTFAGRNVVGESVVTSEDQAEPGELRRFVRKKRGAVAAFALRSHEGALLGLMLLHRPDARVFGERDLELGRVILAHVSESLKSIRLTDSLRASEERFQSIASNVPGVVFQAICGPGEIRSFTYMSDSSVEVFGLRPDRICFAPPVFLERVAVDDLPSLLRSLRDAYEDISPWRWEGRVTGDEGRTRWIQLAARPSFPKGQKDQLIYDGLMLDITEAKELEFQLQLADRMVSVGTLAAGVAHEINNPLTYVLANLGLIREELGDLGEVVPLGEIGLLLDEASEGAERVTRIVRDLKVFSRGDEREVDAPVDVQSVLESSLNMAMTEIRHRAVLIREYDSVPRVLANDARLGQVFLNLLINAAQAIGEGDVAANEICVSTGTDESGFARISVSDTGSGIPEDARKRIFDPFFTTKPVGIGTGLGLPICHRIVAELGGEISVKPQPAGGTIFTVLLPPAKEEFDVEPLPGAMAPPAKVRGRILIVDDEPGVVSALRRGLREHDVRTAPGGQAALDALAKDPRVDIILCDLMMPDLSGMDVYSEIQRRWPGLDDAVIFMTGGAFTMRARSFLADSSSTQISKPFQLSDVKRVIRRKLGEETASAPRTVRPASEA